MRTQKFLELQEGEKIIKEIKPLVELKWYFFGTFIIFWLLFFISFSLIFPLVILETIATIIINKTIPLGFLVGVFIMIGLSISIPIMWLIIENIYKHRYYWITNERVICKYGILGYRILSLPLERISDVIITRNFLERIFGFGSMHIQSLAGQITPEISFQAIPDPEGTQKLIFELIKKKRKTEKLSF